MPVTVLGFAPSAGDLKRLHPLPPELAARVAAKTEALRRIIDGRDDRLIAVVGPCSADFEDSLVAFARRLAVLQGRVRGQIEIVMRFYTGKPRTVGGWKGLSHSDPGAHPNIAEGLPNARRIAISLLREGVGLADEMLHADRAGHFADLLSWHAVGARSSEDQPHREAAAGLDCPVGIKNPMDGSVVVMNNAVAAAAAPTRSVDPWERQEIGTPGNPWAHGILRGALVDRDSVEFPGGTPRPNWSPEHVARWAADVEKRNAAAAAKGLRTPIPHPALVVDCSHENCAVGGKKVPLRQLEIAREVVRMRLGAPWGKYLKGVMVESYHQEGSSPAFLEGHNVPFGQKGSARGLSLTDPCVGVDAMERELLAMAADLERAGVGARPSVA